jgi:uncharacterized membrane protein YhiD involved in acid resistance
MTFNDIFKSSFLEKVPAFSVSDTLLAFAGAFLVGMFIYLVYKKTFSGVMYSRSFNISLVGLTLLTTFVILAVTSNIILSLGMVGALSIVRFRTAIKDPMDLVFLFWAIGSGIVLGAGLLPLAVAGSVVIGLMMMAFASKNVIDSPYIVIIHCKSSKAEESALSLIQKAHRNYRLKSKSVSSEQETELIVEIRIKNKNTDFINDLSQMSDISQVSMVSYNGEYAL